MHSFLLKCRDIFYIYHVASMRAFKKEKNNRRPQSLYTCANDIILSKMRQHTSFLNHAYDKRVGNPFASAPGYSNIIRIFNFVKALRSRLFSLHNLNERARSSEFAIKRTHLFAFIPHKSQSTGCQVQTLSCTTKTT